MTLQSAVLYLVATILWSIRWLWLAVYVASWLLPERTIPLIFNVIDPIFNVWTFFVALVLIFCIGVRKQRGGLWTTIQPWGPPQSMDSRQPVVQYVSYPQPGFVQQQPVQAGWQVTPQQEGAFYPDQQQHYAGPTGLDQSVSGQLKG